MAKLVVISEAGEVVGEVPVALRELAGYRLDLVELRRLWERAVMLDTAAQRQTTEAMDG